MQFILSLAVERPRGGASPLWPAGVKHLVVLVARTGSTRGPLVARGVDTAGDRIVFEARLKPAQLGSFMKAVIDGGAPATGRAGRPVARLDGIDGVDLNTVVVPNPSPPSTGPKVSMVRIATAIRATTSGAPRRGARR
ncbi:MAG TPA: hypothetical protein VFK02_35565 [Kofleriaceae bacterium]|nr:hypothetical protein [Kofleriaceae bacterium]